MLTGFAVGTGAFRISGIHKGVLSSVFRRGHAVFFLKGAQKVTHTFVLQFHGNFGDTQIGLLQHVAGKLQPFTVFVLHNGATGLLFEVL